MFNKVKSQFNRRNLIVVLALAFIAYGGFSTFQVITRNFQLQEQVDQLSAEIAVLELRNQQLEYQIAYYNTDAFVDKEARDKLGLKAPGERVLILSDRVPSATSNRANQEEVVEESFTERSLNNLDQWLYFLFRVEPDET